jgi:hypothetical protein
MQMSLYSQQSGYYIMKTDFSLTLLMGFERFLAIRCVSTMMNKEPCAKVNAMLVDRANKYYTVIEHMQTY